MATPDQLSTSSPRVIRLRASRFGRGTFIGKLLDYASYYVGVAWKLLTMHPAPDRIVALTTPPLLSVLARLFSKIRGADHAHWVMDLYPDVMAAHGMLGEKSIIYRILAGLARWGFGGRRSVAVLTLGPDMAERVGRRAGRADPARSAVTASVQWVPLWGTDCSGVSATVALAASGVNDEGDLKDRDSQAPHSQPAPLGESATVADAPLQLASAALRRQRGWSDRELIVMYSGNMGLGHRFGEILAAAKRVNIEHRTSNIEHRSDPASPGGYAGMNEAFGPGLSRPTFSNSQPSSPIRFAFFGGGKRRVEVESFVRENPGGGVEVHDYAPADELAAHLQSADVHLASLDAAWTGTMVPSKLQGIFAAGRPVIFIGSVESSIGRWVAESGGGWVVPEGDVDGLLAALDEARQPALRLTRGRAAKEFSERHFDKRTNVTRVAAILAARK